jgi:diacylglycerol kinase
MKTSRRTWTAKFSDAFRGYYHGIRDQSSFVVHFAVALAAVLAALLCGIAPAEWALLVLSIGFVMVTELLNCALEWVARAITPEHDERIGRALDIGAGAVLGAAGTAVVVGAIIFGPRLVGLFQT